jgi:sphingolipid delta-4 desaturase
MGASEDFQYVQYKEPHLQRKKLIRAAHPEVEKLYGNEPATALAVFGIVGLQLYLGYLLRDSGLLMTLVVSYVIGAVADHSLWTLIHDCTHNLVFKKTIANRLLACVANLPIFFPAAMSFRVYHLKHHAHQGEPELDADMPSPLEIKLIGRSTLGKITWMLLYFFFQTIRLSAKKLDLVDRWIIFNWCTQLSFLAGAFYVSPMTLFYFFLSGAFAVGLHPCGGRWIQEHFTTAPNQETFSYYGIGNWVAFNVGYHNEHHDFMYVPWMRLPQVRKLAPEFYDHLHHHTSWSALLFRFLFDNTLGLMSRVARPDIEKQKGEAPFGVYPVEETSSTEQTRATNSTVTTPPTAVRTPTTRSSTRKAAH